MVLFLQLPIPLFWFVVHPQVEFWRRHQKASYVVALVCSWPPVTICLFAFHRELFRSQAPPLWSALIGLALVAFEFWLFWRLARDLGTSRLVGKSEISGTGFLADHGIYARIRHPRYTGSLMSIVGACFLAGTPAMWAVAAGWGALMLLAISLEERELRVRFGPAYREYASRVPRFVPRLQYTDKAR
jgi:protein-S-isoprenylcysteine O-methyltransferase Ste14